MGLSSFGFEKLSSGEVVDEVLVIVVFQTLQNAVFVNAAGEATGVDFESDFGDFAADVHGHFSAGAFVVPIRISLVHFGEVHVDILVFLGLIVHDDDVFGAGNVDDADIHIAEIFKTVYLTAEAATEEVADFVTVDFGAGAVAVELLCDDADTVVLLFVDSHNKTLLL